MDKEHWNEIKNNEVLRKRLAKYMAKICFRARELENLHDRIDDDEMKKIVIGVVNNSYFFLSLLFSTENSNQIIEGLKEEDQVPEWNDPEITDDLVAGATDVLKRYAELGFKIPKK